MWTRNFSFLLSGQFVSSIGSQILMIGHALWIKELSDSPLLVGLSMMLWFLPSILISPLGGVVADRYSKKHIMIAMDLLAGVLLVAAAAWVMGLSDKNQTIVIISVLAVLISTISAFFQPASSAFVVEVVERKDIGKGVSYLSMSNDIARILGNSFGAILFVKLGGAFLLLVDGISFLISALTECFITPKSRPKPPEKKSLLADFKEGFAYLVGDRLILNMVLSIVMINACLSSFFVIFPFFVVDTLGMAKEWYGYFISALSVGLLIGSYVASFLDGRPTEARLLAGLFLLLWLPPIAMTIVPGQLWVGVLVFLQGVVSALINVRAVGKLQKIVPDYIKGRFFSLLKSLSSSIAPLSMALSGGFGELVDPATFILAIGIVGLLSSALLLGNFFRFFSSTEA